MPNSGRTTNNRTNMKSRFYRYCTFIGIAIAFPLLYVNYWVGLTALVVAGISATAWLIKDYYEWAEKQRNQAK